MKSLGREYKSGTSEFLKQAADVFDRMMTEDLEQMITFDRMEDRALEVGSELERCLVSRRLSEAAQQREHETACCSTCRKSNKPNTVAF